SRSHGAPAGQNAQGGTDGRATHDGGPGFLELLLVRVELADLVGQVHTLVAQFEVGHDFGETEHAHGDHGEVDAVLQFGNAEVEAGHAGVHVRSHHAQQQAQEDHADGLGQRAGSQYHGTDQAQHHQREILGRSELECNFGQGRSEAGNQKSGDAAGKEGAQGRNGQRRTGPPVARHLVAVQHGHDRGSFAGQGDQNRGGGAPVGSTVVDAGQHDEAGGGRQHIGDGQQHGDGRHGADAGQHADQGAQKTAQQTVRQVLQGQGNRKTQYEVLKQFHFSDAPGSAHERGPQGEDQSQAFDERRPDEDDQAQTRDGGDFPVEDVACKTADEHQKENADIHA